MKKILFVAPHPDDETLGCGGTIFKHLANGDQVFWLIITNIVDDKLSSSLRRDKRQEEIATVAKMYKFVKTFTLDFPTTRLDEYPISDIIEKVSRVVNEVEPHTIYVNNRSDIHTDHQVVFKAVLSCTKSFRYKYINRILMYETLSETEYAAPLPENQFMPNVYIDISRHFDQKCLVMGEYKSEVMQKPLPRSLSSIEALAKYRGSRVGVDYAEAFQLIFEKI